MTAAHWQQLLQQVEVEARQLQPRRVALTLVGGLFFAVGWLLCQLLRGAWLVVAWSWTAALVGWREAGSLRGLPGRPDRQPEPLTVAGGRQ